MFQRKPPFPRPIIFAYPAASFRGCNKTCEFIHFCHTSWSPGHGPPWKFNSFALWKFAPKRRGSSSKASFFSGAKVLNFGGFSKGNSSQKLSHPEESLDHSNGRIWTSIVAGVYRSSKWRQASEGSGFLKHIKTASSLIPTLKQGSWDKTNPNTTLLFSGNPWKSPDICIVWFCLIPLKWVPFSGPCKNFVPFFVPKNPTLQFPKQHSWPLHDWLTAIRIRPTSEQNMRRSTLGPWQALSGYMRWDGWPGEDANIGAVDAERNLDGSEILRENHLGCINKSYK